MPFPRNLCLAIAACAPLLGCDGPRPSQDDRSEPIVGAWRSQLAFRDGALASMKGLEFLYAFNPGGTLTESSNYDGAPPVPPAYGAWRRVGPRRYEARYVFFTTQPPADWQAVAGGGGWMPAGRGELREALEVAADGNTFTSEISLELFDAAGKPVDGGGKGAGRAIRIGF